MPGRPTLEFLKTESSAGLAPLAAAAIAMALANSPLAGGYFAFLAQPVPVRLGGFAHTLSVESWVRDGLMAVFFLIVGLELKFEVLRGELSSPRRLATPLLAAVGGMAVPALIYLAFNLGPGGASAGWPIPTATDIAFALAVLAVAAPGAPPSLRLFLLTLAIADDFGAVAIIGVVFTHALRWASLAEAGAVLALLSALSRVKRAPLLLYAAGFLGVWGLCLDSGVSTAVAGVACALTVPVGARRPGGESMLTLFMDALHPWVAFGILPIFAFTAAGVRLQGLNLGPAATPIGLGVAAALVIGKPVGVFGVTALAALTRVGRRPTGSTWPQVLGIATLAGIGFTMSFFMASLAFSGDAEGRAARLAVIGGSLISATIGSVLLRLGRPTH
jgi:NhaA family Na+:H+ antiporter